MQSIQEVSRHRQNESRHNTVSSVITDTNSSTSVVDGEISLTQQLQSINELSPTYSSMEAAFPSSAETPKHSIKLVIPVKETPQIRLDPPLPSVVRGSVNHSQSPLSSAPGSIVPAPSSRPIPSISSQSKPMLSQTVLGHTTVLLQRTNALSVSSQSQSQPPPAYTQPQISISSQKQEECQQQLGGLNNPTNRDTSELMDSVLDSSELEEVKKIEEQIQKELSASLKEESQDDLDLIRVADGRDGCIVSYIELGL